MPEDGARAGCLRREAARGRGCVGADRDFEPRRGFDHRDDRSTATEGSTVGGDRTSRFQAASYPVLMGLHEERRSIGFQGIFLSRLYRLARVGPPNWLIVGPDPGQGHLVERVHALFPLELGQFRFGSRLCGGSKFSLAKRL